MRRKTSPLGPQTHSGNVTGVSSKHTESLLHAQLMKSIETAHLCLTAATRQQQQQPMAKSIERDAFSALPSHKSTWQGADGNYDQGIQTISEEAVARPRSAKDTPLTSPLALSQPPVAFPLTVEPILHPHYLFNDRETRVDRGHIWPSIPCFLDSINQPEMIKRSHFYSLVEKLIPWRCFFALIPSSTMVPGCC